jgi:hypothetical protein
MTILGWPFYTNCDYCGKRIVFRPHRDKQNVMVGGSFCDAVCQEASENEVEPPRSFHQLQSWARKHKGYPPLEFVSPHVDESAYQHLDVGTDD